MICKHFFGVWKGERTWSADSDEAPAPDGKAVPAKKSTEPYVMPKDKQDFAETRLRALLLPPGLVSGTMRRVFTHTGLLHDCRRFFYCYRCD